MQCNYLSYFKYRKFGIQERLLIARSSFCFRNLNFDVHAGPSAGLLVERQEDMLSRYQRWKEPGRGRELWKETMQREEERTQGQVVPDTKHDEKN